MKNMLKYIKLLLVILLLASCDDYLDVNTDPNNPTEVTPDLVLPGAQKYTADNIQARYRGSANIIGNLMVYNYSQSDGFSWYYDEFYYQNYSALYNDVFEYPYTTTLKEYQILTNLEQDEYAYYRAIGMIMKAFHFQLLVDFFGDVPYSEALLRGENATPVYDNAQVIYADLMVQLTNAIELINSAGTATAIGDEDVMFGGDMDQWKRFANTVKLRILTRLMSNNPTTIDIAAEFAVIAAEGSGYITADVGINPGYENAEAKQNPLWTRYGSDVSGSETMTNLATCATDYVINYLQSTNDPRISYIYEEPATGHLGVPQGLLGNEYDSPVVDQYNPEFVSNIGPGILKSADMDAVIYTLAECNFNLAEAALNGYVTGSAQSYYEAGIQASFDYLGASGASTYYSQAIQNVGWAASSGNELEAIITQKWIATNGITAEQAWFDYTRTGFPAGLPKSRLASTPDRPVRLELPPSEYAYNIDHVPSQPDIFNTKIFWAN